ncbi:RNI-like superfamily protein [Artemisia annua]|uniref:RNI-like superfamily protein n=1 Tax=Artemisia annua TaxID=35608 RepID=A0A2U1KDJ1_ARTAN|nr:RNI-like superfamily protein [Artemisia annua]
MDVGLQDHPSYITNLHNDSLYLIFEKLDMKVDQDSFGLTCHRFLDIQNSSSKCLELGYNGSSFMLDKLLKRFRKLESLSLKGCTYVFNSGLSRLQTCGSKLHTLYLVRVCLKNTGLSYIASGCPLLSVISICSCVITDKGLKILSESCKYLKDVELLPIQCDSITDSGIQSLNQNCRQLRTLIIGCCPGIAGVGFQGCSPTLSCLIATNCALSSTGITNILSGGGLEYLNFGSVKCIGANGLAAIGLGFAANLKVLDLNHCSFVTDEVVLSISKGCPLLQEWNLSYCDKIGTSGWYPIGWYCSNLEILHVNECYSFQNEALIALGNGCKRLSVIHMKNCPRIISTEKDLFITQREGRKIIESEVSMIIPRWVYAIWP